MKKIIVGDCFDFGQCGALGYKHWAYSARDVVKNRHIFTSGSSAVMVINDETLHSGVKLPTLHLPISEPWFSRILIGEKTEEYREIEGREGTFRNCSLIWGVSAKCAMDVYDSANHVREMSFAQWMNEQNKKDFKVLHLTNGYGHHRPQLWAHIKEITIGKGKPEWGAPKHDVFIIKLGEVFHTKNIKI